MDSPTKLQYQPERGRTAPFLVAILAVLVATILRWLLDPALGENVPFITFFLAVVTAAWYGGTAPALVATIASALLAWFLFVPVRDSLVFASFADFVALVVFVLVCMAISAFAGRMRAIELLAKERQLAANRLAAIVESSDDAIIAKSPAGIVTSWNKAAETLFGYSADEIIGKPITTLFPPELIQEEEGILERLRRGERIEHFETVRMTKDGQRIDVSLSISPLRDVNGRLTGASKIVRDITARKNAEAARRASEDRFTTFMQALPGLAWIKDLQGRYVFVNDPAEKAFGRLRDQLYGMTDDELFSAETASQFKGHDRDALRSQAGIEVIESLAHADGIHYSLVSKFPIPGPTGSAAYIGGVAIDITDRMRAEEALRDADRRKDEFLATLAHELRNPLAPIRNAVQILQSSQDDETMRAVIEMLDRQSGQMVRLIDDLLDLSRISRGKIELQRGRVTLRAVVDQALETTSTYCTETEHHVSVEMPPEPIFLNADPVRLAQVFGNLLHNACKFSPRGSRIVLRAEKSGQEATICVQDTGIGIPQDQLRRIFEMFSQVHQAIDASREGLGIGLNLVKNLVELHGGTVEAHSAGIGQGSEFVVRLPTAPEEDPKVVEISDPARRSTESQRILVVDDNQDAAKSLAMILKRLGHTVQMAHDGLEAVEAAANFEPDLVLLDIGLPKMNGYEAGRLIRARQVNRNLVLVALTGWGQPEDRLRSQEAGFDAHLVKPVDFKALTAILHRFSNGANH